MARYRHNAMLRLLTLLVSIAIQASSFHCPKHSLFATTTSSISRQYQYYYLSPTTIMMSTKPNHPHQQQQVDDDDDTESSSYSLEQYLKRFRKFRTPPHYAPNITKILLLSDLHMDYPANQEWLYNLCCSTTSTSTPASASSFNNSNVHENDDDDDSKSSTMIIIAGDISHNLEILSWTFTTLQSKFAAVSFTPGNHELWMDKPRVKKKKVATTLDADDDDVIVVAVSIGDANGNANDGSGRKDTATARGCTSSGRGDGCTNSIEKLERIFELCVERGVHIGPVGVGSIDNNDHHQQHQQQHQQQPQQPALWVIPLLSWHHHSFDTEPPIECWGGIPSARKVVMDYRRAVWPLPLSAMDDTVAQFVDGVNDAVLDLDMIDLSWAGGGFDCSTASSTSTAANENDGASSSSTPQLLTFSHFLPRIELLPEKRYLSLPTLASCVGSTYLELRLRQLRMNIGHDTIASDHTNHQSSTTSSSSIDDDDGNHSKQSIASSNHVHAFGHTHLAWDATIDGVRYVHVPLAYPREWEARRRSLEIGTMNGEMSQDRFPVCIWQDKDGKTLLEEASAIQRSEDEEETADNGNSHPTTLSSAAAINNTNNNNNNNNNNGFPQHWLGGWWSKYYTVMPRRPHLNTLLSPWAAKRFRQLPGGMVEDFDHLTVEERYQLQCPEK